MPKLTVIPAHTDFAGFAPTYLALFLIAITAVPILILLAGRPLARSRRHARLGWRDLGFKPRMHYTATTHANPVRVTFEPLYQPSVHVERASEIGPHHRRRSFIYFILFYFLFLYYFLFLFTFISLLSYLFFYLLIYNLFYLSLSYQLSNSRALAIFAGPPCSRSFTSHLTPLVPVCINPARLALLLHPDSSSPPCPPTAITSRPRPQLCSIVQPPTQQYPLRARSCVYTIRARARASSSASRIRAHSQPLLLHCFLTLIALQPILTHLALYSCIARSHPRAASPALALRPCLRPRLSRARPRACAVCSSTPYDARSGTVAHTFRSRRPSFISAPSRASLYSCLPRRQNRVLACTTPCSSSSPPTFTFFA